MGVNRIIILHSAPVTMHEKEVLNSRNGSAREFLELTTFQARAERRERKGRLVCHMEEAIMKKIREAEFGIRRDKYVVRRSIFIWRKYKPILIVSLQYNY